MDEKWVIHDDAVCTRVGCAMCGHWEVVQEVQIAQPFNTPRLVIVENPTEIVEVEIYAADDDYFDGYEYEREQDAWAEIATPEPPAMCAETLDDLLFGSARITVEAETKFADDGIVKEFIVAETVASWNRRTL